jgi:DNA polymerase iota
MSLVELSEDDDHSRTILHFDIDCFYAQAETLLDPSLSDKAVGIQQKNIVVTCNYLVMSRRIDNHMWS